MFRKADLSIDFSDFIKHPRKRCGITACGASDGLLVNSHHSLYPRDSRETVQRSVGGGKTKVIEHNLDLIRNADYVVDMGPGGGSKGGRIVTTGTPSDVASNPESATGRHLKMETDSR